MVSAAGAPAADRAVPAPAVHPEFRPAVRAEYEMHGTSLGFAGDDICEKAAERAIALPEIVEVLTHFKPFNPVHIAASGANFDFVLHGHVLLPLLGLCVAQTHQRCAPNRHGFA